VARRTVGQLVRGANFVLCRELLAHFCLIRGRFPIHVEDLIARTQILFGIAVTFQAPLHIQWRSLEHQRHLVNRTVARGAANAFIDVNAVIEIDVVRKAMHAHPLNRLIGAIALANWLEISDVIEKYGMAIPTGFRGRDAGERGGLDASVTVTTIDAVVAHVMLVAELNGLTTTHPLIGDVGRSGNNQYRRESKTGEDRGSKQTKPRNKICTAMKDLGHVSVALVRISSPEGRYSRENRPHLCRTVRVRVGESTA
jgi:hypothetical protein